jgi:hypothetical protein
MNITDKDIVHYQAPWQELQKRIFRINKEAIDLFLRISLLGKLLLNLSNIAAVGLCIPKMSLTYFLKLNG